MRTKMLSFLATSLVTTNAWAATEVIEPQGQFGISFYQGQKNLLQAQSDEKGADLKMISLEHEGKIILKIDAKAGAIVEASDDTALINQIFWWRVISLAIRGTEKSMRLGRPMGAMFPPLFSKDKNGCTHAVYMDVKPYCPEGKSPYEFRFDPEWYISKTPGEYRTVCMCGSEVCPCPGDMIAPTPKEKSDGNGEN